MKNTKKVPLKVINLRNIWDSKKREFDFTQTSAAKELGWTQGAISNYLNCVTELNAQAIIKLANFLGVDPRDIDPDITEHLPNVEKRDFAYNSSDLTKLTKSSHCFQRPKTAIWVNIDSPKTYIHTGTGKQLMSTNDGDICHALVCAPKEHSAAKLFLCTLKGEKRAHFYTKRALDMQDNIDKRYSLLQFAYK